MATNVNSLFDDVLKEPQFKKNKKVEDLFNSVEDKKVDPKMRALFDEVQSESTGKNEQAQPEPQQGFWSRVLEGTGRGAAYQAQMSPANPEVIKQQGQFVKGAASGATLGLSEKIPGMKPEKDNILAEFGDLYGKFLPISAVEKYAVKPLVELAKKSPLAPKAIAALTRMGIFGVAGADMAIAEKAIKEGELPTNEEIGKHALTWMALDGAIQLAGKTASFALNLGKSAKVNGVSRKEVLNGIVDTLNREGIDPAKNPEEAIARAEELFHGSPNQIKLGEVKPSQKNKYGSGFYATESEEIAENYSRKFEGAKNNPELREKYGVPEETEPTVYKVKKKTQPNLLNIEEEIPQDIKDYLEDLDDKSLEKQAFEQKKPKTIKSLYDEIHRVGADENIPHKERVAAINRLNNKIKEEGFDGIIYKENNAKESVFFEPQRDLEIEKVTPKKQLESATTTSEFKASTKPLSMQQLNKPGIQAKIPTPRRVETPHELKGKSPEFVVSRYVQHKPEATPLKNVKFKSVLNELDRQLLNKYRPLHDLGNGSLSPLDHPGKLADTMKGYTGRLQNIFEASTYDLETMAANGPGLNVIFNPKRIKGLTGKSKLDRAKFDYYLAAKSSLERQQAGQANPIPTEAAEKYIEQHKEQFDPLAKDLNKFTKNSLANIRKSGLISKEAETAMNQLYEDHAPLHRVFPKEKSLFETLKEKGAGISRTLQPAQPLKRATGSHRQIISPTESIVKNTIAFEQAIAKNDVMKATGKALKESLGGEVETLGPKKFSKKELQELLGDSFEVTDENYSALNEAANIGRVTEVTPGKISWFEDGVRHQIAAPKEVVEAVQGMTPSQANAFIKIASGWRNLFSKGIVLEPGTLARISGLSNIVSTLQSRYPATPLKMLDIPYNLFYQTPRMLFKIAKRDDLYQDFLQSGAAQTMMQGLDREMLSSMADTYFNAAKSKKELLVNTLKAPIKATKAVVKGLEKVSNMLSDAERMIEFEKSYESAIGNGLTRKEAMSQAAYDAYHVSVPYGREGQAQWLQSIYQIVPFSRTITNSSVTFAEALKDPNNVIAATAYLTVPTLALYLRNRNDPRYQAIPQKDRDKNLYYWLTDSPNERPSRIGKFWQWGFMFQTIPEHAVEYILQKDPKAFKDLAQSFEYEFSPFTFLSIGNSVSENGFDPSKLLEGRFVKVPDRYKKLEAELQSTSNTSEVAKVLSKHSNTSPIYVDWLINQTAGGLGSDVVRVADEVAYSMGWTQDRREKKFPQTMIFYSTFLGQGPSSRSQHLNEFYEYADKFETMKRSANEYRKRGDNDKANKLMENYQDVNAKKKRISTFFKQIEKIRGEVNDPSKLKKSKQDQLNEIYLKMTNLCRDYVEKIKAKSADKEGQAKPEND